MREHALAQEESVLAFARRTDNLVPAAHDPNTECEMSLPMRNAMQPWAPAARAIANGVEHRDFPCCIAAQLDHDALVWPSSATHRFGAFVACVHRGPPRYECGEYERRFRCGYEPQAATDALPLSSTCGAGPARALPSAADYARAARTTTAPTRCS